MQGLPHKYHLKTRLSTFSVANILKGKKNQVKVVSYIILTFAKVRSTFQILFFPSDLWLDLLQRLQTL